jgi:hypothetical protein
VVSGTPTVTKHPYDEEVVVGDSTSFVAYANDAKQYVWELLTVDGGTISCSELAGVISGLGVSGYNTAELVLTNIPLTLDGCKCAMVEVKLWDGEGTAFPAIREEAVLEITSYGGDAQGYQIPFNVHYTGIKQKGTFDVQSKTFTPAQ